MVRDVAAARELVALDDDATLGSPARPIVLAPRRATRASRRPSRRARASSA